MKALKKITILAAVLTVSLFAGMTIVDDADAGIGDGRAVRPWDLPREREEQPTEYEMPEPRDRMGVPSDYIPIRTILDLTCRAGGGMVAGIPTKPGDEHYDEDNYYIYIAGFEWSTLKGDTVLLNPGECKHSDMVISQTEPKFFARNLRFHGWRTGMSVSEGSPPNFEYSEHVNNIINAIQNGLTFNIRVRKWDNETFAILSVSPF